VRTFLGLGSNLGRKRENLARARRLLEKNGVRLLRLSAEYRTQPVGDQDQPWFINQVVEAETCLEPSNLLALIKRLEKEMKRRPRSRGGPRRIDIDILLAGRRIVSRPWLRVPHPRLAQRNFVLIPLAEIAPGAIHPVLRKTIRRLLRETNDRSSIQKLKTRQPGKY
jgi:2-amino-4-hydroxy-6-hydroxymethyldihydropteridine diphosphokinase